MFRTKQPMFHRLYDKQLELFKVFITYFLKPEAFTRRSGKQMKAVEIEEKKFSPKKICFWVEKQESWFHHCQRKTLLLKCFWKKVVSGYKCCGIYLHNKLPLDNKVLRSLSALDPDARQHSSFLKALKTRGNIIPARLTEEEEDCLEAEIHRYLKLLPLMYINSLISILYDRPSIYTLYSYRFQADDCLPHETERVDSWWGIIKKSGQYPALSKVDIAACTIFHGPMVESSFNANGDIMDPKCSNMQQLKHIIQFKSSNTSLNQVKQQH